MYRLINIIFLSVVASSCMQTQAAIYARPATKTTFIGNVCFPPHCKTARPLNAYYKGCKIDITQRSYTIKDRLDHGEFYFLFTLDGLHPESTQEDPNTIKHFKMPASNNYLCYRVSKNPVYWNARFAPQFARKMGAEKAKDAWHIQELRLPVEDKKIIHLPEHTIVFLINPKFVEKLEQEDWDSEMNTTKVPKIVLKKTVSEKELNKMLDHAILATADFDVFHRKPTVVKEVRPDSPIIISIVTD